MAPFHGEPNADVPMSQTLKASMFVVRTEKWEDVETERIRPTPTVTQSYCCGSSTSPKPKSTSPFSSKGNLNVRGASTKAVPLMR